MEKLGIVPDALKVLKEVFVFLVLVLNAKLFTECSYVHRFLDLFQVIMDSKSYIGNYIDKRETYDAKERGL